MPGLTSKSDNSSMGPGRSITRINSLPNILRPSFGIRSGRLNILGASRAPLLNNGSIGLLLRRRKSLQCRGHEEHEIGLFRRISTYRQEDNHRFHRILAIRCIVDFLQNVKEAFGSYKMLQNALQSKGPFRVAVKGTYCLCLNRQKFPGALLTLAKRRLKRF